MHIAAHDFDAVEVFATRAHFDYHDANAIAQLGEWLSDTSLTLHSMHAPIFDAMKGGKWVGSFSNASGDEQRRKAAIAETQAALQVAAQLPYRFLVVHLGMPFDSAQGKPPGERMVSGDPSTSSGSSRATSRDDNQPGAARRSVEEIAALAAAVNVKVAIEVIPHPLSSAASLVSLIEDDLDGLDVGICLDYGHAHLMGDLGEAIETLSGHLWTTHVHDNRGKQDDHLVPFAGSINWDLAIMETQKIGYEETMMFEVADTGNPIEVLERSAKARERLEKTFVTF